MEDHLATAHPVITNDDGEFVVVVNDHVRPIARRPRFRVRKVGTRNIIYSCPFSFKFVLSYIGSQWDINGFKKIKLKKAYIL